MNEELKEILGDFGVDPAAPTPGAPDPAATPPATDPVPPVTDPVPPADPQDPQDQQDPAQPGTGTQTPADPVQPKPENGIKQLREAYNQTKQEAQAQRALLEKIAASRGISVEALSEQLKAEDDKRLAKERGIPEEVQKTMREQAEQLESMRISIERERFQNNIRTFQLQNKLSDDEVIEFIQAAGKANIDLVKGQVPLDTLYFAMNRTSIEAKIRQAERQAVYDEIRKQGNGNALIKLNPGSQAPKKGLDEFLADLQKTGLK